jgi:predicted nuclease of predicted toxin-antitoxin system
MLFLLYQGLPRSAVTHLAKLGSAQHVGDLGLSAASDELILEEAQKLSAIVVTLDADFHSLLANSKAEAPSVIRIRIEGLKGDAVARIIQRVAAAASADLIAGAAISVTLTRMAIRRLPLQV